MSFKSSLDIGCFNWEPGASSFITRPLLGPEVEAAIVRSGGRLLQDGHATDPTLTLLAKLMVRYGKQNVLGFVGREPVVLHPSGYVRLPVDDRSAAAVAIFLRLLNAEFGCGVYVSHNEDWGLTQVLAWLESMAPPGRAEIGSTPAPVRRSISGDS